ncbi:hypothetical protein QBC38DRAFT_370872, partial [Podospora fimiseda]
AQRPGDIVIAVMGETGSGKSTFIHNFNEHAEIGYGAESKTDTITAFETEINGKQAFLVDTIGTNDAERKEGYILQQMAQWLSAAAEKDVYLSGLIYLFNITKTRVTDSDTHELRKFKKLCGQNAFKESRITLATTFWSELSDEGKTRAEATEKLFEDWFWKDTPIHNRQETHRITGRKEAYRILELIAARAAGLPGPAPLQLQEELADGKTIAETEAGNLIKDNKEEMQKTFDKRLKELEEEYREAKEEEDKEAEEEISASEQKLRLKMEKEKKDLMLLTMTMEDLLKAYFGPQYKSEPRHRRRHRTGSTVTTTTTHTTTSSASVRFFGPLSFRWSFHAIFAASMANATRALRSAERNLLKAIAQMRKAMKSLSPWL